MLTFGTEYAILTYKIWRDISEQGKWYLGSECVCVCACVSSFLHYFSSSYENIIRINWSGYVTAVLKVEMAKYGKQDLRLLGVFKGEQHHLDTNTKAVIMEWKISKYI